MTKRTGKPCGRPRKDGLPSGSQAAREADRLARLPSHMKAQDRAQRPSTALSGANAGPSVDGGDPRPPLAGKAPGQRALGDILRNARLRHAKALRERRGIHLHAAISHGFLVKPGGTC